MEIDGNNTARTGDRYEVGYKLGRDRHPRFHLAVLSAIAVVRDYDRDPIGGGPPERIHDDEQLHQVVIDRDTSGLEDKDIPAMLDRLALGGDKVIFTRARGTPRAAEPEELHRQFNERCGKMSQVATTLPQALDLATRAVGRDDLICITGSFYLVGEARKYLEQLARKRQQEAAPV